MARCEECNRKVEQPSRHLVNGRILCGIHDPRPPHERQTQELPRDRGVAQQLKAAQARIAALEAEAASREAEAVSRQTEAVSRQPSAISSPTSPTLELPQPSETPRRELTADS